MHHPTLLVALSLWAGTAFAQYEVRREPASLSLSFSLRLPAAARESVALAPRGATWGLKPQVSAVRCDGKPLPAQADGTWMAPAGCRLVTWRVVPDRVSAQGADASLQRTLAVGPVPWFLIAEPTALLRPAGVAQAATLEAARGAGQLLGAIPLQPGAFRVPALHSAPEFYVLGRVEPSARTVSHLRVD